MHEHKILFLDLPLFYQRGAATTCLCFDLTTWGAVLRWARSIFRSKNADLLTRSCTDSKSLSGAVKQILVDNNDLNTKHSIRAELFAGTEAIFETKIDLIFAPNVALKKQYK